jgi:hypothetical protein
MADPTFDEIIEAPTQTEALDGEVFTELQTRGLPTSDWGVGDPFRTLALAVSRLWVKGRQALAALAASAFEDYVFGFVAAPFGIDVTSWAKVTAKQRYNIDRIEASHTTRTIRFTNSTATVYGPYNSGDLIVTFTAYDGPDNRYVLDEDAVSIAGSTTTDLVFRSEYALDSAGGYSYNHASATTVILSTASLPGVTATNPAGTFTDTALSGTSEGTVTPTGTPGGAYVTSSWAVEILVTGQAAACTWRYRAQNNVGTLSAWTTVVATAAVANALGSGITITLANDATVNPSFVAGDVFRFATPGTDVVVSGRDAETPQALGTRCRGIWPLLNHVRDDAGNALPKAPAALAYETLARSASNQVVHVKIATGSVNNEVVITVAGQGSALAPATITAIQGYFDSISDLTDYPVVSSPTKRAITLGGGVSVTCKAALLTAAQTAMQNAVAAYFLGTDTANVIGLNPLVDRAYLVKLIRSTAGVTKTDADTLLTINGAAADLQLPVTPGAVELATWAQTLSSLLTWVPA